MNEIPGERQILIDYFDKIDFSAQGEWERQGDRAAEGGRRKIAHSAACPTWAGPQSAAERHIAVAALRALLLFNDGDDGVVAATNALNPGDIHDSVRMHVQWCRREIQYGDDGFRTL